MKSGETNVLKRPIIRTRESCFSINHPHPFYRSERKVKTTKFILDKNRYKLYITVVNPEDSVQDIEAIWMELLEHFSNWKMVKPRMYWLKTGVSERLSIKRLKRLENSKAGQEFFKLTKNLSDQNLDYLKGLSQINYEQALPAARVSVFINVSLLFALLSITSQLFPGYVLELFNGVREGSIKSDTNHALAVGFFSALFGIIPTSIGVSLYSFGGVAGARDLKNLIELSQIRRRIS